MIGDVQGSQLRLFSNFAIALNLCLIKMQDGRIKDNEVFIDFTL